jgi:hypothetical protein
MPEAAWRSREDLLRAGWTASGIDNAIRRGRIQPVARGILLPRAVLPDLWQRCAGALATQRVDAAISRRTAALARGFAWLPREWGDGNAPICITAARDDLTRSSRIGIDRRLSALPPEDVVLWNGLRITMTRGRPSILPDTRTGCWRCRSSTGCSPATDAPRIS